MPFPTSFLNIWKQTCVLVVWSLLLQPLLQLSRRLLRMWRAGSSRTNCMYPAVLLSSGSCFLCRTHDVREQLCKILHEMLEQAHGRFLKDCIWVTCRLKVLNKWMHPYWIRRLEHIWLHLHIYTFNPFRNFPGTWTLYSWACLTGWWFLWLRATAKLLISSSSVFTLLLPYYLDRLCSHRKGPHQIHIFRTSIWTTSRI